MMPKKVLFGFLSTLIVMPTAVLAEETASTPLAKVTDVYRVIPLDQHGDKSVAKINDNIRVAIDNYASFIESAGTKEVHLFLDGREVKGVVPEVKDPTAHEFQFCLRPARDLADQEILEQKQIWAEIFGFRNGLKLKGMITVSVGLAGADFLPSDKRLTIIRVPTWRLGLFVFVVLVLVPLSLWAGWKGVFNDRDGVRVDSALSQPARNNALSLGRVQMGWWFFLTVVSFFYLWLALDSLPTIPPSVLSLIGISSGSALGAIAITANKREVARVKLLDAERRRQEPNQPQPSVLDAEIKHWGAQARPVAGTGHWYRDLLEDANGVSFHRLQMVIWTLVLGIVFVQQVVFSLVLPDFDSTLLALMGISSGTYLGFKSRALYKRISAETPSARLLARPSSETSTLRSVSSTDWKSVRPAL